MVKRLDTLKRALTLAGGRKALCAALWISNEELNSCLEGKKPIPEPVYQAALEIVERDSTKK